MQVLEEEWQVYFSVNEWGSVGTMLQLLIVLFKPLQGNRHSIFCKGSTTAECLSCINIPCCFYYIRTTGEILFFLPNENSNEDSFLIRELPFAILSVHI